MHSAGQLLFLGSLCQLKTLSLVALCLQHLLLGARGGGALRTEGPYLLDRQDRVVTLRGLNIATDAKVPDFQPIKDLGVLDSLVPLGVNAVRLLFIWEAYEPERGNRSASYLQYYKGLVERLWKNGIWTIIDVHQDTFSRFVNNGCGDGFPAWAVQGLAALALSSPRNDKSCTHWGVSGATNAPQLAAWEAFYSNVGGVRDAFLDMWESLAGSFSGHEGVIGYDLLNEPYGNERTQLALLYADAAERVRRVDNETIVFVSPGAFTAAGVPTLLPAPAFAHYVLAAHVYSQQRYDAEGVEGMGSILNAWTNTSLTWGVPLVITEYGAAMTTPFGSPALNAASYVGSLYGQLDARWLSGLQWGWTPNYSAEKRDGWNSEDFSVVDEHLHLREMYQVRPYPVALAGQPESFLVWSAVGQFERERKGKKAQILQRL